MPKVQNEGVNMASGSYTVVVNGEKFSVQVAEGNADIQVTPVAESAAPAASSGNEEAIKSPLPGNVWKIVANPGDSLKMGDKILILESMKMEIDIVAPHDGVVKTINVNANDKVVEGQVVAVLG